MPKGRSQRGRSRRSVAPHPPAPLDEVVIVEIKRGTYADGRIRKATDDEVAKFHRYVLGSNNSMLEALTRTE